MSTSNLHRFRISSIFIAWSFVLLVLTSPAQAQTSARSDDPRKEAAAAEKRGDWLEACLIYDDLLRKDRNQTEIREAYRRCLRQAHLARRHRDATYREAIARLTPEQAQALFVQVLRSVSTCYVDREKLDLAGLVLHGVEELRFALDDDAFVQAHLPGNEPAAIEAFRNRLNAWQVGKLAKPGEAKEQLAAISRAAQQCGITIRPNFQVGVALECCAGVCNSLDEYSLLLSPGYTTDASARARPGSPGLELSFTDGRAEVARVYHRSAAADAGILAHDRIIRVGDKVVGMVSAADINARLKGDVGTTVELEIVTPPSIARVVKIVRRTQGVEFTLLAEGDDLDPIGYIRIPFFHENTVSEVQEALASMSMMNLKGLILDLRGNPGGMLKSSLQVSELFLSEGILAHATSHLPEFNRSYRTELHEVCPLPLAVLVDGETASSAELLAGALKEHGRARLLGQTTFGKGSIQCLIPLDMSKAGPAGIRLTVARFYSPTNQPYSGVGLTPHDQVDAEGESPVTAARQFLRQMR